MGRIHAARRLQTGGSGVVKAPDGHTVAVKRCHYNGRVPGQAWWSPHVLEMAYDTKTRVASRGDFSEAELAEMERLYGAKIRRPEKEAALPEESAAVLSKAG